MLWPTTLRGPSVQVVSWNATQPPSTTFGTHFSKSSSTSSYSCEPSLTSSGNLFASGLSASGRLTSARSTSKFYGNPLVAWTPAFGASVYEVQWSKTRSPFKPQPNAQNSGAPGAMTLGTAAVLPLAPGTWYYRVRGFNYSLPTNAQQMSWSDPARIVVSKPKFAVVGGKKK